jgi:hypothetical protein
MKNYYLKFEDQAELEAILLANDLATMFPAMNGEPEQLVPKTNLDVIGLIYKPTGNVLTAEDGFEYLEQAPITGWHANLKANLTEEQELALTPFLVPEPATPTRKWAGE